MSQQEISTKSQQDASDSETKVLAEQQAPEAQQEPIQVEQSETPVEENLNQVGKVYQNEAPESVKNTSESQKENQAPVAAQTNAQLEIVVISEEKVEEKIVEVEKEVSEDEFAPVEHKRQREDTFSAAAEESPEKMKKLDEESSSQKEVTVV